MKAKILITALFGMITMLCFSQENTKIERDTSDFAFKINPFQDDTNSFDLGTNKLPEIENSFKIPELNFVPESDLNINRALSENQNSFDNMPIYNPRFNDNMPVWVPDSTVDYKLKIKKYNGGMVKPNVK